jgi:BirA family biotin operon repressor/biotin-[acetyl-CoA-carboxylase] ligase
MSRKIKNEAVIELLQKKKYDFVSGAEIADVLGASRAAVWKKINRLKQNGYTIESSRAKGYRLMEVPGLSIEEIRNALSGRSRTIGREIIFYDTVSSTNTIAAELAGKSPSGGEGHTEGTVIIANGQTGGRGRRGRVWVSPPEKNLYMSIIVMPDIPPIQAAVLTLMTAVACTSAIRRLSPVPVSIKWPNDLMVSDKKLGGILTEIKADMDRIFYAVIGIGVNINLEMDDVPDDIRSIATSLKHETGQAQSRTKYAIEILDELEKWYGIFLRDGKKSVIEEWSRLTSTIGKTVKVTIGDAVLTGTAEKITDEGMLALRISDNSLKVISSGDVTVLR